MHGVGRKRDGEGKRKTEGGREKGREEEEERQTERKRGVLFYSL
jgi:hypothetical protein